MDQSACSILDTMSSIIHSPRWDAEINSFIEENSLLFNNEEENSHQHFQLHVDYIAIVNECLRERLAESGICEEEFLRSCSIFQAMVQDDKKNDDARTNILDSLLAMGDYQSFKLLMLETNTKLEMEALQALRGVEMISIADIKEQNINKNVNTKLMRLTFEDGKASHIITGKLVSDLGVDMMGSMATNNSHEDDEEDTTPALAHYHDSGDTISCANRMDPSTCQIHFSGSDLGVDTMGSMATNNTHEDDEEDTTPALAHYHDSDYSSQVPKTKCCQKKIVKLNPLSSPQKIDSTGSVSPKHQHSQQCSAYELDKTRKDVVRRHRKFFESRKLQQCRDLTKEHLERKLHLEKQRESIILRRRELRKTGTIKSIQRMDTNA